MSKYNQQQQAVIEAPIDVPAIVCSAGAGTGKTHSMVGRVKYLISQGISPDKIAVVTLTKQASIEMWERLVKEMPQLERTGLKNRVCTIHALNYRLLKKHTRRTYEILDVAKHTYTRKDMLQTIMTAVGFGSWHKPVAPDVLYDIISRSKLAGFETNESRAYFEKYWEPRDAQALFEARMRFDQWCEKKGFLTFSDMLLKVDHLLRNENFLRSNSGYYVIVDEAQDTTKIAMSILGRMARNGQIWMVGDINQTLFVFANAHPNHNIGTGFEDLYPAGLRYPMQINYRSTRNIIDVANRLVANSYELCGCGEPSSEYSSYCDECYKEAVGTELAAIEPPSF